MRQVVLLTLLACSLNACSTYATAAPVDEVATTDLPEVGESE